MNSIIKMLMPVDKEIFAAMTGAMESVQDYLDPYVDTDEYLTRLKLLLLGIVSSAVEVAEIQNRGSAAYLWAEIEAGAKQGGLAAVAVALEKSQKPSISEIDQNDTASAMNYLGQQMATALFKHIHDLPERLRTPEMFLRAIEALLANLLHDKFKDSNPHKITDDFCEHIHMCLQDLEAKNAAKSDQDNTFDLIENIISSIDDEVKIIMLRGGDDKDILVSLGDKMPRVIEVMRSLSPEVRSGFYEKYPRFYKYMKLLETLASDITRGKIKVP